MNYEPKIKDAIAAGAQSVMEFVVKEVKAELQRQGHVLTGGLLNSIELVKKFVQDAVEYEIYMREYGVYLDQGVKPENIPYTPGSGAGESSFIEGLQRFFRLLGLPEDETLGAAFALANVARTEGLPTRGSYRYSSNGERLGFLTGTIDRLSQHPWLRPGSLDSNSLQAQINDELMEVFYTGFLRHPNLTRAA